MPSFSEDLTFRFFDLIAKFFRRLPRKTALRFGVRIGDLFYHIVKKRRQIAIKNLEIAFGNELTSDKIDQICRRHFRGLGKNIAEFFRFPLLTSKNIWEIVSIEGEENLRNAIDRGKGVIIFLPHFGNWEILSLIYGALLPNSAKAIAFPLKNRRLDELIWEYRQRLSLELIPKKNAIRQTLKALKKNCAIGFFADQNAVSEGVFVDLFGKSAYSVRGPISIVLKTDATLLFSSSIRQTDDRHLIRISPPIEMERSGNYEVDVQRNTQKLMKMVENLIREFPDQWLWIHDRWKTEKIKVVL